MHTSLVHMPKHHHSSLLILDKLHHLSKISSSSSTPTMKVTKATAGFLKKVATSFKTRLLFLASARRRTATVGVISHGIHKLMSGEEKATARHGKAGLAPRSIMAADEKLAANVTVDLSVLSLFQEDDVYPDWVQSLFDDGDEEHCDGGGHGVLDSVDEPSVIDEIRSSREDDRVEFNIEDDIDRAADMFIRRMHARMNRSLQ